MNTIMLSDGVEIQVELSAQQAQEISSGSIIKNTIENLKDNFTKIVEPISQYVANLELGENVSETKVAIGIKIGAEGNLILSKSSVDAHITIEFTIKK